MGGAKTLSIIVAANIKGLETAMKKANKSVSNFGSTAARVGSMLTFGVTAPLVAMGKSAMDTFVNFESGMAKVKAVTGATQQEFEALTESARELGSTTRFTTQQVADLQLVLGRKGFSTSAIIAMEDSILKLATATGEDLSLAAEVVATSINAFNLQASEASRVANTLASSAANSSIQLNTFATAFGHAGASANAVGVDIEELSAMMGVLMDNGIKASKAGTGLRKIFMKLHQEGRNFSEVLDLATQGNLGLERAMRLAGVTSANQLLILAENKKRVAELTQSYKTNTGELDRMNSIMTDTAEHKLKLMQSAIEGLKLEFGSLISKSITPIIKSVTELAKKFTNLDDSTKDLIIRVGGFLAVIGPLLIGFGALVAMLNPITGGILAMGAAFVGLNSQSEKQVSNLEKERQGLNNLVGVILTTNKGSQKRKDLIVDLNKRYPNFLSNLDSEKVTNKELSNALRNTNKEYIKKIELQARETEITEALTRKIKAQREAREQEEKGMALLNDIRDKQNIGYIENFTVLENLQQLMSSSKPKDDFFLIGNKIVSSRLVNQISDIISEIKRTEKEFEDATEVTKKLASEIEGLGLSMDDLDSTSILLPEIILDGGTGGGGLDEINDRTRAAIDLTKKFTDGFAELFVRVRDAEGAIISFKEKFNKFANQFLTQIGVMILQAGIFAAILSLIFPKAAIGGKNFMGNFMNLLTGGSGLLEGRAKGGPVSGNTPYLVGENGPELFMSGSSGTIIPNHALGGGSVIPDVRISGNDLLIVFNKAQRRKNLR